MLQNSSAKIQCSQLKSLEVRKGYTRKDTLCQNQEPGTNVPLY